MSQDFLTLEGRSPRKRRSALGFLSLGESFTQTAAFKKAAAREDKAALVARQGTSMWVESDEAGRQNEMAKRIEELVKDPNAAVTGSTPDLFATYMMGENISCGNLDGWFNLKRMFTPPARVRNIVKRIVPKQVTRLFNISTYKPPKAIGKALRYAGALNTLPLTLFSGKLRNKMFGLTGGEQKVFDTAAKVSRVVAAAVVAVVAAPAVGAAIGKLGASAGAKAGWLKYLSTPFGKKFALGKMGSLVMKDISADAIWKITKSGIGSIVASKISKNSVSPEEYAALPNNEPVEVPSAQIPVSQGRGPSNAGAGQEVGGGAGQGYQEIAEAGSEMPASVAGANSLDIATQQNPEAFNDPAIDIRPEPPYVPPTPSFDDMSMTEVTDEAQKEFDMTAQTEVPLAPEPTEEEQPGADFERDFEEAFQKVKAKEQAETLGRSKIIRQKRKLFAKKVAAIRARPSWL